jgi:hypothetical protein
MWAYVIAGLAGAAFASGRAPKTRHKKLDVLGTRSGLTWKAEDFPELGVVIVRGNGAVGVFRRGPAGFVYTHGKGDELALRAMAADFSRELLPHP